MFLSCLENKKVILISHDLSRTGSPLLLIEAAQEMIQSGANVSLVSLARDNARDNPAVLNHIPLIPIERSFLEASQADLVIANTAVAASWVREYLDRYPQASHRLIWWIHEIDTDLYAKRIVYLDRVAALVLDSYASLEQWKKTAIQFPPLTQVIHPGVRGSLLSDTQKERFHFPIRKRFRILGFKPPLCSRDMLRQRLGVGKDDFLISLIGSYTSAKGHDLVAATVGKILSQNPRLPLKLLLIGFHSQGQKKKFLAKLTVFEKQALDSRRMLLFQKDLNPFYKASDAFIMNSQGLGENFGRVTTEAMAFGLPVLATNAGGTPEVVVDGLNGLLYPVGEKGQELLAQHILFLMNNRVQARTMGSEGCQRIHEHFTDAIFFQKLSDVLNQVLSQAPNRL